MWAHADQYTCMHCGLCNIFDEGGTLMNTCISTKAISSPKLGTEHLKTLKLSQYLTYMYMYGKVGNYPQILLHVHVALIIIDNYDNSLRPELRNAKITYC